MIDRGRHTQTELSIRPVSQQTKIDFSDYKRMGTIHHGGGAADKSRWLPAFTLNDGQLRAVLMRLGNRYLIWCCGGAHPGPVIDDWKALEYRCTEVALNTATDGMSKYQASLREVHKQSIIRVGGYLALHAAVAYRYWRLGQGCVAVAEALGISPTNVRQIAHQMVRHARTLGFETYAPHWTKGRKFTGKAFAVRRTARHRTLLRRFDKLEDLFADDLETIGEWHKVAGKYTKDLVLIEMCRWNDLESRRLRAALNRWAKNPKLRAEMAARLEAKNREIAARMGYEHCVTCRCRPIHFARSYVRCAECL